MGYEEFEISGLFGETVSVNSFNYIEFIIGVIFREAVSYLAEQFAPLNESLRRKWMTKVIDKIHALKFNSVVLEKDQILLCLDVSVFGLNVLVLREF